MIFIYDFNMQRRRKMLLSLMLLETKMEVINIFDYYYGLKSFLYFIFVLVIFIYDFDMQIMRKMLVNLRRLERKMEVINVYSFMIMFYILFVFVFCL